MGIIIDVFAVLIIITSVYLGYKKGIVNVGFKLFALLLSLVVSIFLYSPITYLIVNNTDLDEKIEDIVVKNAIVNAENESNQNNQNDAIHTYIQNYAKDIAKGAQNNAVQAAAKPIAITVIRIGVIIVLYVLTRVILIVLKTFTNIITKIPILKQCNEVVGLVYGILRGLIIIYVLLAIAFFIVSMSGENTINTTIQESYVTKYFYNNNIILNLMH